MNKEIKPKAPNNLRLELEPYPHLRDDEGCVLAADYINEEKMKWILELVANATKISS